MESGKWEVGSGKLSSCANVDESMLFESRGTTTGATNKEVVGIHLQRQSRPEWGLICDPAK